jgi:hypothetical protein
MNLEAARTNRLSQKIRIGDGIRKMPPPFYIAFLSRWRIG